MNFDELVAQPVPYRPCYSTVRGATRSRRVWDWLVRGHTLHICTDHLPDGGHLQPHHCAGCRLNWTG